MILEYLGHSSFKLTLADGAVLVMDPYGSFYQYPLRRLKADICTVSHHHGDHDAVSSLEGNPLVLDTAGVHLPKDGITVQGIPTFHDEVQGKKRGSNLIFLIEAEGLRLAHLGDLGHRLAPEQMAPLQNLDLLLLPVGGYYTIDASTAAAVMQDLAPKVTIPMHYKTKADPDMPIAPVSDFLALVGVSPEPMALLRVTAQDISQRPAVLLMTTPEGL